MEGRYQINLDSRKGVLANAKVLADELETGF
jgi:hypothetical protein